MAYRERELTIVTSLGSIKLKVYDCVYEPSDDTALAIESLERLRDLGFKYSAVLDLGTGTGVLLAVAEKLFKPLKALAVDISPYAAYNAKANLPATSGVVQCNAGACLRGPWDLVIVNPPYIPDRVSEVSDDCLYWESVSWSEAPNHELLCREAARLGRQVLIIRSSLSSLDVDRCLSSLGLRLERRLGSKRLFMEELYAELWSH